MYGVYKIDPIILAIKDTKMEPTNIQCQRCGQGSLWQGRQLPFHFPRSLNGNPVCPNCYEQYCRERNRLLQQMRRNRK